MEPIIVPMGEIRLLTGHGILCCQGLGSCIGLLGIDTTAGVAAMAHILLPDSRLAKPSEKEGRFADTAVKGIFTALLTERCKRERIIFIAVGGSQVFGVTKNCKAVDIGARNYEAVREALKKAGGKLVAADVGGEHGRTVTANCKTGRITICNTIGTETELCNFRDLGGQRAA